MTQVYGDYPPLDALPSDALRRSDAQYYYELGQQDWLAKHEAKNRASNQRLRDAISEEMRAIEARQNKLKVLL